MQKDSWLLPYSEHWQLVPLPTVEDKIRRAKRCKKFTAFAAIDVV